MIRLVWLFLIAAALAAGAAILSGQTGEVSVRIGAAEYRMAPAVAAALCVLAIGLLIGVWRLIGLVFDLPGAMSRSRRERRRKARYLSLARGMVAVAAGDVREAKRHAARAQSKGRGPGGKDEPLLAQLLNAQTAQLDGDEAAAARAYADMLGAEETEFLGLRGLFVQATRRGDKQAARRYAARAFQLRPQTPWVAAAVFDLEAAAGDWAAAERALTGQAKAKLLDAAVVTRRRAVLAAAAARDRMAAGRPEQALKLAGAALKTAPGLLEAALAAAAAFRAEGRPKRAAKVLEKAWEADPHPALAAAYAPIAAATGRSVEGLIALRPEHVESRLLSAARAAVRGDHRAIETILGPLLDGVPSARAARLMADAAAARGDIEAARLWADQALAAPRDGVWRCSGCGHESPNWGPVCESCGAFDTQTWRDPVSPPAPALAGDAATLLYRLAPPDSGRELTVPRAD